MIQVAWSAAAEADLGFHTDHLAIHSPRVALALGDAILHAIDGLRDFSEIGRVGRVGGTRELVVLRIPYLMIYSRAGETLNVLRILHGAQLWPPDE